MDFSYLQFVLVEGADKMGHIPEYGLGQCEANLEDPQQSAAVHTSAHSHSWQYIHIYTYTYTLLESLSDDAIA